MLVICEQCGIEYSTYPSLFNRSTHHFCSSECKKTFISKSPQILKAGCKKKRKKLICLQCGAEREVILSSTLKFCSEKCYNEFRKK